MDIKVAFIENPDMLGMIDMYENEHNERVHRIFEPLSFRGLDEYLEMRRSEERYDSITILTRDSLDCELVNKHLRETGQDNTGGTTATAANAGGTSVVNADGTVTTPGLNITTTTVYIFSPFGLLPFKKSSTKGGLTSVDFGRIKAYLDEVDEILEKIANRADERGRVTKDSINKHCFYVTSATNGKIDYSPAKIAPSTMKMLDILMTRPDADKETITRLQRFINDACSNAKTLTGGFGNDINATKSADENAGENISYGSTHLITNSSPAAHTYWIMPEVFYSRPTNAEGTGGTNNTNINDYQDKLQVVNAHVYVTKTYIPIVGLGVLAEFCSNFERQVSAMKNQAKENVEIPRGVGDYKKENLLIDAYIVKALSLSLPKVLQATENEMASMLKNNFSKNFSLGSGYLSNTMGHKNTKLDKLETGSEYWNDGHQNDLNRTLLSQWAEKEDDIIDNKTSAVNKRIDQIINWKDKFHDTTGIGKDGKYPKFEVQSYINRGFPREMALDAYNKECKMSDLADEILDIQTEIVGLDDGVPEDIERIKQDKERIIKITDQIEQLQLDLEAIHSVKDKSTTAEYTKPKLDSVEDYENITDSELEYRIDILYTEGVAESHNMLVDILTSDHFKNNI